MNEPQAYHKWMYDRGKYIIKWRGVQIQKPPEDLWTYAQIIQSFKALGPARIIETGSADGGSALWFWECLNEPDLHDSFSGLVLSVDVDTWDRPSRPGLRFVQGDSANLDWLPFKARRAWPGPTLVSLDSDHRKAHVLKELELYSALLRKGDWLVVEDTNINGRPVLPGWGDGPGEAVDEWKPESRGFEIVEPWFGWSFNTWLRKL